MNKAVKAVTAALVGVLAAVGVTFVVGMRRKSAPVVDAVRRLSRRTNRRVMPRAGTDASGPSVIRHVGRRSGRSYSTPVQAVVTDDGFAVALPYGGTTDWVRNVVASGKAEIVHDGTTYDVDQPQVVALADVARFFTPRNRLAHRVFGVREALRVRRVQPVATDAQETAATRH